jgi:hypothetical protein
MILNESHCLVFLLIPEGSKINRFSKLPQLWNLHYHTLMTLKCHHCLLHPFGKYPKYTRNVVIYAFLIYSIHKELCVSFPDSFLFWWWYWGLNSGLHIFHHFMTPVHPCNRFTHIFIHSFIHMK